MRKKPPKLLVDCDPGHDDALALIMASSLAELIGVTTVSGNASLEAVTANALAVLDMLAEPVPVHSGAAGPLVSAPDGMPPHATHVHGADGLGGSTLLSSKRQPDSDDAVSYLLSVSKQHAGLWLVAIGPLTNIALAIERDPAFASRLAGISIMGGSTQGGNVTATAEFNVWADPEAAAIVLSSGARVRLCGLNLTHQLKTSEQTLHKLRGSGAVRARFAAELIDYLHERMQVLNGVPEAALHDPCAVLAVTHPELFEFRNRSVLVERTGELTRGMTVIDERFSGHDANRQAGDRLVEVAYKLDAEAAFDLFFSSLEDPA